MAEASRARQPAQRRPAWPPGTRVAVRNRYTATWTEGFRIEAPADGSEPTYWLRRTSDGAVLPVPFPPEELREA